MRRRQLLSLGLSVVSMLLFACSPPMAEEGPSPEGAGTSRVAAAAPVRITKTVGKKVYAHVMPWFETPASSGNGAWGIHWRMANQNPNIVDGTGRRQIASYYYPLIGPYASGDKVYNNRPLGLKFGVAYPGFQTFYSAGGWGGPAWSIPHNGLSSFNQTLELAKNSSVNHLQLATWNDYGEGTLLEPTREFGYGFLTSLQQQLGVPCSQRELELVHTLYQQRKQYAGNAAKQAQLDEAFSYLVSLQVTQAANILNGGSTPSSMPPTNPGFESGMTGGSTWSPNGMAAAAFSETYNGAQSGAYHLTHWSTAPFETWTYQPVSGLAPGSYKVRAWVRKGGDFNSVRLQAQTCGGCTPVFTALGTYSGWTQVETPVISVSAGYLEVGFHSRAPAANGASFVHMDGVELLRL